jgi:TPR repeat protein
LCIAAVEKGYGHARIGLGNIYIFGKGVPMNLAIALEWLLPEAEAGDALAQGSVGKIYSGEMGSPPNYGEAIKWRRRAIAQGDKASALNLGGLIIDRDGFSEYEYQEALFYLLGLAKYNNVDAIYGVGIAYETWRGVVENKTTAFEWFMIEGNLGHPEPRALLG